MSVIEAPVEGVVLCQATAARCVCIKPLGHVEAGDPVHGCDPVECGGSWTGDYDDPASFRMVTPPIPKWTTGFGPLGLW